MSSLRSKAGGEGWDWGKLQCALEDGDEVVIRQATDAEYGYYERKPREMKARIELERAAQAAEDTDANS